jgi:metal-dependent amidase/aminoacylase/carboxypeptidase family protein
MIDDGLFTRFPCDRVFALHNWPALPPGRIGITPGPAMAAAGMARIRTGRSIPSWWRHTSSSPRNRSSAAT